MAADPRGPASQDINTGSLIIRYDEALTTFDEGTMVLCFPKVVPASEYRRERRRVLNRNEEVAMGVVEP